jgi:hypothetical protein
VRNIERTFNSAFGRFWYGEPDAINNAIGYAKSISRSHDFCDSRLR